MPGLRHDLQEKTFVSTSSPKDESTVARDRAGVPENWSQCNRNQVLVALFELLDAALTLDFSLHGPVLSFVVQVRLSRVFCYRCGQEGLTWGPLPSLRLFSRVHRRCPTPATISRGLPRTARRHRLRHKVHGPSVTPHPSSPL